MQLAEAPTRRDAHRLKILACLAHVLLGSSAAAVATRRRRHHGEHGTQMVTGTRARHHLRPLGYQPRLQLPVQLDARLPVASPLFELRAQRAQTKHHLTRHVEGRGFV